jgi:hypothetical protein
MVGAVAATGKARAMSSASVRLDEARSRSCPRESDGRLRVSTLERESESDGGGGIFRKRAGCRGVLSGRACSDG